MGWDGPGRRGIRRGLKGEPAGAGPGWRLRGKPGAPATKTKSKAGPAEGLQQLSTGVRGGPEREPLTCLGGEARGHGAGHAPGLPQAGRTVELGTPGASPRAQEHKLRSSGSRAGPQLPSRPPCMPPDGTWPSLHAPCQDPAPCRAPYL